MSRIGPAALSGLLLVLALPKPDLPWLGWVALIPLFKVVRGEESPRRTFLCGYTAGVVFFGGTCYWIVSTMNTYGGLPLPVSLAVFALFVAVFALHTAAFALLLRMGLRRWGVPGLLLAAPLWVGVEYAQTWLVFGGFPWMLSGYALVPFGGILPMVTWTGVYGLSFVLVAVNALGAVAIRSRDWRPAAVAAGVVLVVVALPAPEVDRVDAGGEDALAVRIVQTHIPIDFPWGGTEEDALLAELSDLSAAGSTRPGLVVWPETPGPFLLDRNSGFAARMAALSRRLGAHLLVGYIDFRDGMPTNSAGLLSPDGDQISRYDKIHLVPFGEYVPLGDLLFFAGSLVRNVGDFHPGSEYTTSTIGGHRIATTICYEDVFPALMRRFPLAGAELIVNITNDGWFGSSSAPYQHLRMARVRAVENGRWIVRAANTGISALIDPHGNITARTDLGERTTLEGMVRYRSDLTPYARYGDVFALAATLAAIAFLAIAMRAPRSRRGALAVR